MHMHTVCRLCSACCPITAQVQSGRLISASRKSLLPPDQTVKCPKLRAAPEIVYSDKRLNSPWIRSNKKSDGTFKKASWTEALDLVAAKFKEVKAQSGTQSTAWLRGMAADWGAPWDYVQRLMNAWGSPNSIGNGSVCHVAREMAHVYTYGGLTLPRIKDSKCILVWGKNDRNTLPGAFEALLLAKQNGGRIIVVDPVKTPAAELADIWLQIKPAHDGQLAMAMIREIITQGLYDNDFIQNHALGFADLQQAAEQYPARKVAPDIWLDAEQIQQAARMYAQTKPACIVDGNGLDMQLQTFQATRAVCMLRALTGNLDQEGGDFLLQPPALRNIQLRELLPRDIPPVTTDYQLFNTFHHNWGLHAQSCLIDAILEEKPYPVKLLMVQSGNPALTMTDASRVQKALQKLDFLAVMDPFWTKTADFADVVLPAATCFEKTQLNRTYMRTSPIILQNQVIDLQPGAWPDWKIIFELGRKLGLNEVFPWQDVEQAIDYQLQPTGFSVEQLREHPEGLWADLPQFEKFKTYGLQTPSGQVEFYSARLEQNGHWPVPYLDGSRHDPISYSQQKDKYNLVGMSGERENRFTHTQFHNVPALLKNAQPPQVDMHQDDARELNIENGDLVLISSPKGQIRMPARISDSINPGSVIIAWGWGEVHEDFNLNLLTDDEHRDPVTSTPSNRTFMCNIQKLQEATNRTLNIQEAPANSQNAAGKP